MHFAASEPSWHRRDRRKRSLARKFLRAISRLLPHHGSDLPRPVAEWLEDHNIDDSVIMGDRAIKKRTRSVEAPKRVSFPKTTLQQGDLDKMADMLTARGADLGRSAVDQLNAVAGPSLAAIDLRNPEKARGELLSMLRDYDISYTAKHLAEKKRKESSESSKPSKQKKELPPTISLDEKDWTAPLFDEDLDCSFVALEPTDSLQGWLSKDRSEHPQLVIFLAHITHPRVLIRPAPFLWKTPQQEKPSRVWKTCSWLQLGDESAGEVALLTEPTVVTEEVQQAHPFQIRINGAHAPTFQDLIAKQFSDARVAGRHNGQTQGRPGKSKTAAEQAADASLKKVFEQLLNKLVPSANLLSPIHRLIRLPTSTGTGNLQCTVSLDAETADKLYTFSGPAGVTGHYGYPDSDPNSEKHFYRTILVPKHISLTLDSAYQKFKGFPGFKGCMYDSKRNQVGIRVLKQGDFHAAISRALGVIVVDENADNYRVYPVPLHFSTKSQLQTCLDEVWQGAAVVYLAFDKQAKHTFASVSATTASPDLCLPGGHILTVEKIEKQAKMSKPIAVNIGNIKPPPIPPSRVAASSTAEAIPEPDGDIDFEDDEPTVEEVDIVPQVQSDFKEVDKRGKEKSQPKWLEALQPVEGEQTMLTTTVESRERSSTAGISSSPFRSQMSDTQDNVGVSGLRAENDAKFADIYNRMNGMQTAIQQQGAATQQVVTQQQNCQRQLSDIENMLRALTLGQPAQASAAANSN